MMLRAHAVVLPVLLALAVASVEGDSAGTQESNGVDLEPAKRFDGFRLYYGGDSFEELPLTDVDRDKQFGNPRWVFIYGDCEPEPDDPEPSCWLPLQVHNHTICDRFPARYPSDLKIFNFHGAKAARNPYAGSFEVYTGRTTVVIFTDGTVNRKAVAEALRPVRAESVPERLRPPAKGSLRGELRCQRRWRR